ncbi:hypothetical protein VHTUMSATKI_43090 [Vibrio harveyi]
MKCDALVLLSASVAFISRFTTADSESIKVNAGMSGWEPEKPCHSKLIPNCFATKFVKAKQATDTTQLINSVSQKEYLVSKYGKSKNIGNVGTTNQNV